MKGLFSFMFVGLYFSLVFQNHDVERVKEHTVQSQILVPEKLPVSNIQGEVLEILLRAQVLWCLCNTRKVVSIPWYQRKSNS